MHLAPRSRWARMLIRPNSADASIKNSKTALSRGLEPSFTRSNMMIVTGGSEPTSISVVLKFSKDIRKQISPDPIGAGLR